MKKQEYKPSIKKAKSLTVKRQSATKKCRILSVARENINCNDIKGKKIRT